MDSINWRPFLTCDSFIHYRQVMMLARRSNSLSPMQTGKGEEFVQRPTGHSKSSGDIVHQLPVKKTCSKTRDSYFICLVKRFETQWIRWSLKERNKHHLAPILFTTLIVYSDITLQHQWNPLKMDSLKPPDISLIRLPTNYPALMSCNEVGTVELDQGLSKHQEVCFAPVKKVKQMIAIFGELLQAI